MSNSQHTQATPLQPESAAEPQRPWWKRTWVVATAALLVGAGVGSAGAAPDPTSTGAYRHVSAQRDTARVELGDSQASLQKLRSDLKTAQAKAASLAGDLPDREQALTDGQQQLAKDQRALDASQAKLRTKEKRVSARERKVGIAERTIRRNTISGDGVYEVGSDIKAGTYKTSGSNGCYYAVLNSPSTLDIADNNNVNGPAIVTVSNGQYLELTRCADWVRQH